jgi:hypothetical protein
MTNLEKNLTKKQTKVQNKSAVVFCAVRQHVTSWGWGDGTDAGSKILSRIQE